MKRLLLIIFLALSVLVIVKAKEEAVPGEFPWTVSLELDPQQGYFGHDCGGAILNENWIITTGYCGQLNDELDHNNFIVIAGEFNLNSVDGNEQIKHVKEAFVHPYFNAQQGSDVALLKLDSPLELNDWVQPISLATDIEAVESSYGVCIEAGWSLQDGTKKLQKSNLTLIDTEFCQQNADDGDQVPDTSFCGGSVDVFLTAVMCPGYTGSPVSCNDVAGNNQKVLVGLQSFNWACNTPNVPAIYTSLRQMRQWIDYILEKEG